MRNLFFKFFINDANDEGNNPSDLLLRARLGSYPHSKTEIWNKHGRMIEFHSTSSEIQ